MIRHAKSNITINKAAWRNFDHGFGGRLSMGRAYTGVGGLVAMNVEMETRHQRGP